MAHRAERVPHYTRIADDLAGRIARGELTVADQVPSETELQTTYAVSRGTARRAIKELRDRGLIRTIAHRGSYVAAPTRQPG